MEKQVLFAQAAISASILGLVTHLSYFIRDEHHFQGPKILLCAIIAPIAFQIALVRVAKFSMGDSAALTTIVWWAFVGSLFGSMLIYRAFFHRLRSFPGPFNARLTKLWHSKLASGFNNHKEMGKLHAQYGEFVRTGPSEISITDPAAVDLVHGPGNRCTKTMWYDMSHPRHTLQLTREKPLHDRRRRMWDRAFSTKALRSYDGRVSTYADQLISRFKSMAGKPANVSEWFNNYTADTLFDLAFGKSFNLIKEGKGHWFLELVKEGSQHLATLGPIPWFFQIAGSIRLLMAADTRARKWCDEQVQQRKAATMEDADVMSWLLDPPEPWSDDPKENDSWLTADARLLIVAGTDTTTAGLTYATYHLCKDTSHVEKIRAELIEHGIDKDFSVQNLRSCAYLNGFIDETLRLHPPVPSGVYRNTPPEGLKIGDYFVPGDVTVIIPIYTIQRSPKCFVDPDSFIPERWTTRPELILNNKGFMPFNVGAYGCVGKQLAYMEMRTVLAKLVLAFVIEFAPGEDGTGLLELTKDYFILGLAGFNVVFSPRQR